MATPTYEFSGVVYTATADQTTFALTTDTGRSIGYLKFEHIHVRVSTDDGENWVNLVYTDDWVFADPTTSIVLNTPVAAGTLVDIHRTTPMEDDYIDFQKGSLLTAGQLNEFDTWQLYVDQELNDKTLSLEGDLSSLAVTQIIAGDNITINPEDGKGPVTINAADPPVTRIIAGEYVELNPASGLGDVTVNVLPPPGGLTYKGPIDATGPAPSDPQDGDLYINTAESGVVGSSWTGIAGTELVGAERLIYGGDTSPNQWSLLENPGVPEAPSDGEIYGRSDEEWVAIEGFPEAPEDGDIYGRSNADWVAIEGFPEAPQDGEVYGRSNGGWVVIPPGTVVSETAPADPAEGQQWWADSDVQDGGGRLYIYTGEEWVDTSLPGVGADFDETKAEELFLKLDASNDPVTGNCEFTAGVSVTGGDVNINSGSDLYAFGALSKFGISDQYGAFEITNGSSVSRVLNMVRTGDGPVGMKAIAVSNTVDGEAFSVDYSGLSTHAGGVSVTGGNVTLSSGVLLTNAPINATTVDLGPFSAQADHNNQFVNNSFNFASKKPANVSFTGIGPANQAVLSCLRIAGGFNSDYRDDANAFCYGIESTLNSAANGNTYNIFASGSAHNYFAGSLGIGDSSPESALSINKDGTLRLGAQEGFMISGQPIGGLYFGNITNPSAGIECDWQGVNNPTLAIGTTRDKSTGNLLKAQTRYQYDASIRHLINEEEVMRIQSNGVVIPSNKGISFEYSSSSGATGTSNFLKDYESGQFTPSLTDVTGYKYRNGHYTKIGDMVYFYIRIQANASTPSGSPWQVTGLPYSSANLDCFGGAWRSYGRNIQENQVGDSIAYHIPKNSTGIFAKVGAGTANVATNNSNHVILNEQIILQGFYKAAGG